jgi:predicted permease
MTNVREQVRGYGWENVIGVILTDARIAMRRLRSNAGFAVVAIVTLTLGIGASTAIFSVVNAILFESLPYPQAKRLVTLRDQGVDGAPLAIAFGTYREIVARTRSFDALAVARSWQPTITGPAQPERFDGQRVSASYFRTIGVTPAFGRDFDAADDRPGGANVAIVSDGVWRRRFGADSTIIGRQITLDDAAYTVIGVMPREFEPVPGSSSELWSLLQYGASLPSEGPEWGHNLRMIGRLHPGVTIDQASRDLDAIARNPVPEFSRPPWAAMRRALALRALQDDVTSGVRPALLAVLGAVLLVLAIACVNVTNLLLARGAQRRGEFAMRAALGAGRGRLIAQLLTESLLLAAIAGVMGLVVARIGVRALISLAPADLPRGSAIGVSGAAFLFAFAASTAVGVVIGLVPALQASRADLHAGLQHGSRRTAGSGQMMRRMLVVAEVALALVLLTGAGLLLRSLERLFAVDPGFVPARLLTMRVQASSGRFDDDGETFRFFSQALTAVRQVPGVTAAAFTSQLPLSGDGDMYGVHFESSPTGRNEGAVFRYAVTPGFFEAMRIPLRRGRVLDATDKEGSPPVVVINESFAKRKFPGRNPIGQHLHVGPDRGPWFTVVGVVGDVKQLSLATSDVDAVYMPTDQSWFADRELSLVVRARGDAAALATPVKNAVWSVDKDQPIVRVATMDAVVAASAGRRRFALIVFEVFAGVALVLAATGIYGVLSGSVAERMRELGVRSALGASPRDILALVIRQGMTLSCLGAAIGVGAAAVATRAVDTLLFGISRLDPVTYASVASLLLGVSLIACWLPAWRAARVDPTVTLRAE